MDENDEASVRHRFRVRGHAITVDAAYAVVRRVESERGIVALYNPGHATSLIVMGGQMEIAHARAVVELGESMVASQAGEHSSFHDHWSMTGYDSAARTRLTEWVSGGATA